MKIIKNIENIKHTEKKHKKITKNKKMLFGEGRLGKTPRYLLPLKTVQYLP